MPLVEPGDEARGVSEVAVEDTLRKDQYLRGELRGWEAQGIAERGGVQPAGRGEEVGMGWVGGGLAG